MSAAPTLIHLCGEDGNLQHYLSLLQEDGWEVQRAASLLEATARLARAELPFTLIARSRLDEPARQLADLRAAVDVRRVVLWSDVATATTPEDLDVSALPQLFRFSDLLRALGVGGTDGSAAAPRDDADGRVRSEGRSLPSDPRSIAPSPRRDDDEREHARGSAALPRVYEVIHACRELSDLESDRDALLDRAVAAFKDLTGARRVSLMLATAPGRGLSVVRRLGFPRTIAGELGRDCERSIAESVFHEDEPLLIEDAEASFPGRPERGYASRSFLSVPLRHRHATVGVVNLTDRAPESMFDEEDLAYVMMLADQLAVTLRNADLVADLQMMTVMDPLTRLHNRRHFDQQLDAELQRARRYGRQLSLALLDVDNFKLFNDLNGYVAGDHVLSEVAEVLRRSFREIDIVTRWGGDEFAVILPETSRPPSRPRESRGFFERIRRAVQEWDYSSPVLDPAGGITVSVGVATFPIDCLEAADLFRKANQALQQAKKCGSNRIVFADELAGLSEAES